ncbi:MAG: hypothetical protein ACE5R6_01695 [Candidatus Heimdallarchaeota archaeon]
MAKLFGSSAISTIEEPNFCPAAMNELKITTTALEKIYALAEIVVDRAKRDYEVYCFLLGNEQGCVEDILIPEQEVTSYSVEIPKSALLKLTEELETLDSNLQVLGWAHSHAKMGAFSSLTDDENHVRVLHQSKNFKIMSDKKTKYAYGLTVSLAPRNHYGVVVTQFDCGAVVLREATLDIIDQETDTSPNPAQIKTDLTEEVLRKVTIIIPQPLKWKWRDRFKKWFWGDAPEDLYHKSSIDTLPEDSPGLQFVYEGDREPKELLSSLIIDSVLTHPDMTDYIAELSSPWYLLHQQDNDENEIRQKIENIIKIAILITLEHIQDTITSLSLIPKEYYQTPKWKDAEFDEESNSTQYGGNQM